MTLDKIIEIENQDLQLLSLNMAWQNIKKISDWNFIQGQLFLFLILQNALVSYQIAGRWELWRQEFADKITADWHFWTDFAKNIKNDSDFFVKACDWRLIFLKKSKYNHRIYNIKKSRIEKFFLKYIEFWDICKDWLYLNYYENMNILWKKISITMDSNMDAKTIVFAVKMFGYGARIVFDKLIYYPFDIPIPLDSRIYKIYQIIQNSENYFDENTISKNKFEYEDQQKQSKMKTKKISDQQIYDFFFEISKKYKIPSLHLDSYFWQKY